MAEAFPHSTGSTSLLPEVRLEVRQGTARPLLYEVTEIAFLIGNVSGCDLRLPGSDLPPVVCMIVRQSGSLVIRRLAPSQAIQINGRPLSNHSLSDGDRITVSTLELVVHAHFPVVADRPVDGADHPEQVGSDLVTRTRELDSHQRQLDEQARVLESDRADWQGRRQNIEREQRMLQELQRDFADASAKLRVREEAVQQAQDAVERQRLELQTQKDQFANQHQEVGEVRRELADVRQDLYDRYRQRRDRLAGLQEAVNRAAEKVQERKRLVDAETAQLAPRLAEIETQRERLRQKEATHDDELATRAEELKAARQHVEELEQRVRAREHEVQQQSDTRAAEHQSCERQLAKDREELDTKQLQYEADVIRLDRLAASLEERQRQVDGRALEIDQRYEQMQRDSRDMEEQAGQLHEWHTKLCAESEHINTRKTEVDALASEAAKRASDLEGQQVMLATLRTRLERMREEMGRGERQMTEQRARQEQAETELRLKAEELDRLKNELEDQRQADLEARRSLEERHTQIQTAEAQLRQLKDEAAAEQEQLRLRGAAFEARAAKEAEATSVLQARSAQLLQLQERVGADRQSLREREGALAQAELAREALQEQLRRRSEELNERLLALAERERQQTETASGLETRRFEMDHRAGELGHLATALSRREESLRRHVERLKESGRTIGAARKTLGEQRARWASEQEQSAIATARQRAEFEALREEAVALQRQLPDLEEQAHAAGERLAAVRQQLQEHLSQLHTYVREGQEAFEAAHSELQRDADHIRQQATGLNRVREEHRLAVADFRQQLITWQGQVAEMRRDLSRDESRLERRHAEVEATSVRLAQQAEQLQVQEREVTERRGEVDRHLADMREWYRRKLRELSERHRAVDREPHTEGVQREGQGEDSSPETPGILRLTGPIDTGDRHLGDLLQSLELVEADTLAALFVEARRQNQSLRQVLLASGYVTLYQLALIEAGNVDGLVLGPVRVLDRLRVTPREIVYHVFDPRRGEGAGGSEALLRHLAEAEMQDAVHPDEFCQRFGTAAAIQHPNVLATWQVLEINGRPAVLQEWLTGLPATDWPALVTVSGVWYRLVSQAALGLSAAHEAGLVHGRLDASRVLLTGAGFVKICGFGEPPWLAGQDAPQGEPSAAEDLAALGRLATRWATMPLPRPKGGKPKPLAEPLQPILQRLGAELENDRYPTAAALVEDLDGVSGVAPVNPEAWNRFLRFVREKSGGEKAIRQSA
jgi:DNA repair exonuclease SbcCD ATPase subunit